MSCGSAATACRAGQLAWTSAMTRIRMTGLGKAAPSRLTAECGRRYSYSIRPFVRLVYAQGLPRARPNLSRAPAPTPAGQGCLMNLEKAYRRLPLRDLMTD